MSAEPAEPKPDLPESKDSPSTVAGALTLTHFDLSADGVERPIEGKPEERYHIRRRLAAGGQGELFEATDKLLERPVAVKYVKDARAQAQFWREARGSGRLDHPNIPPVFDLGVDSHGRPYYVMRMIRGRSLEQLLADSDRWTLPRLLALFVQLCSAVEFAHSMGLLHLDIKPANVMIGEFNEVYLVDWGATIERGETLQGLRGTPAYMSPEQASQSSEIDTASDAFSLGVVLFELVLGQRAFPGSERLLDRVKVASFDRGVGWDETPVELTALIDRVLQADPMARPSVVELSEGVQAYLDGTEERQRQSQHASDLLARAGAELLELARLRHCIAQLELEVEQGTPKDWYEDQARRDHWQREDTLSSTRREASLLLRRATEFHLEAIRHAQEDDEVRQRVASFFWQRFVEAEATSDEFQASFFEGQIRALKLPEVTQKLNALASVFVEFGSEPQRLVWERLEEVDRRLQTAELSELALTRPLELSDLQLGPHRLVASAMGYADSIYPLNLQRGSGSVVSVRMRQSREVGEDFVYVPEGEFTMGGDAETLRSRRRSVVGVDEFCVARFPVTWSEYREFVQAVVRHSETDALGLLPSLVAGGQKVWHISDGQVGFTEDVEPELSRDHWPIFSVTYSQASDYCRWYSEKTGIHHQLPSDEEWEKAARGTDERIFPWGNQFVPNYCCNSLSTRPGERSQPKPVGAFPTDCSPYGVRDMAGGVRTWCRDWLDKKDNYRLVRGGSWNQGEVGTHCAYRLGCAPSRSYEFIGFRLVHHFEPYDPEVHDRSEE